MPTGKNNTSVPSLWRLCDPQLSLLKAPTYSPQVPPPCHLSADRSALIPLSCRKFQSGVDICGVADNFLINDKTHLLESRYNEKLIGPVSDLKRYKEASPVFFADKIAVPILILQGAPLAFHPSAHLSCTLGAKDTVVVKEHSLTIKERARNSPYVEYHEYPNEGHMLASTPTKLDLLPHIESFLRKWVLTK